MGCMGPWRDELQAVESCSSAQSVETWLKN
jgi:hypothetical protein